MKQLKKLVNTILTIAMVFGLFAGSGISVNAAEKVKIEVSYFYIDASGNNKLLEIDEYVPEGTLWKDFLASYVPCFKNGKISDGHSANKWEKISIQNHGASINDLESSYFYNKEIQNFNQFADAAYVTYYGYPDDYKRAYFSFEALKNGKHYDSGTGFDFLIPSAYAYGSEQAIAYADKNFGIHEYIMDYANMPGATYTIEAPWEPKEGTWDGYVVSIDISACDESSPSDPTPAPEPETEWKFGDVEEKPGNWKYEAVKYVTENGIMNGTSSDEFKPDDSLTRAMFATMLYRMAGQPEVTFTNKFPDVPANKWYSNAVIWASSNGIVGGYGNGNFGTNDFITREQISKMLMEFGKVQGYDISQSADIDSFADASDVSGWASAYVRWAVGSKIINGKTIEGKLCLAPKGDATRAESAAMLMRFMEQN